jgi:hypothetical protein
MTDTQSYYVYENQRWNPLTGYSARGLPTDRPPWSDKSGKQKCSKEKIRLRSMHWQWVNINDHKLQQYKWKNPYQNYKPMEVYYITDIMSVICQLWPIDL